MKDFFRFGGGTFNKFPPKVYPALKASFVNLSGRSPRRWAVIDLGVSQVRSRNGLSKS
ncbi:hypothetical protein MES5069_30134 [Mesorhizobium escarrei]|uniref:Uncharacterized protein n=1 Tax=Mesorhizobium escarrei TaxID=666018 RepID=A0ABN8JXT9_9HYPH|nr:hypothetical protein MES5069_30134 [Mesorhizobium escarrei]